jgi:hypothetical protein
VTRANTASAIIVCACPTTSQNSCVSDTPSSGASALPDKLHRRHSTGDKRLKKKSTRRGKRPQATRGRIFSSVFCPSWRQEPGAIPPGMSAWWIAEPMPSSRMLLRRLKCCFEGDTSASKVPAQYGAKLAAGSNAVSSFAVKCVSRWVQGSDDHVGHQGSPQSLRPPFHVA